MVTAKNVVNNMKAYRDMLYNTGKVIRKLRLSKDIFQKDVTEGSGLDHSSYSLMESGKRDLKLSAIKSLADFYEMTPGQLVDLIFAEEKNNLLILKPTDLANAAIIAAAPDLLEALQKAVNDYGNPGGPWNVPSEPGTWIAMARAALDKALSV